MMEHKDFARYDTSSIEFMGGGGAPTPPSNVAKIAQKFPKGQPGQGYGLTEVPCFERRRKLHEYRVRYADGAHLRRPTAGSARSLAATTCPSRHLAALRRRSRTW